MIIVRDDTDDDLLAHWVYSRTGGQYIHGMGETLAAVDPDGTVFAGAVFTQFNGVNIFVDLAIEDRRAALPLFSAIGHYAFEQLGCKRLTFVTDSANIPAQRLHKKLGADFEARLVGAASNGNDILISRLTSDSRIWRRLYGREIRLGPAGAEL